MTRLPKTAKGLRARAISIRLKAYNECGGVGSTMLRAEHRALKLEDMAKALEAKRNEPL